MKRWQNRPQTIGRITTHKILSNMPTVSTSTIVPANHQTRTGVSSGASKVDAAVIPAAPDPMTMMFLDIVCNVRDWPHQYNTCACMGDSVNNSGCINQVS